MILKALQTKKITKYRNIKLLRNAIWTDVKVDIGVTFVDIW